MTRRANLAFAGWVALGAPFALVCVVGLVQPLRSVTGESLGFAMGGIGGLLVMWNWGVIVGAVWWYRRDIGRLAASDVPEDRREAWRRAEVTVEFSTRGPIGVDTAGLRTTWATRHANGQAFWAVTVCALVFLIGGYVLLDGR